MKKHEFKVGDLVEVVTSIKVKDIASSQPASFAKYDYQTGIIIRQNGVSVIKHYVDIYYEVLINNQIITCLSSSLRLC